MVADRQPAVRIIDYSDALAAELARSVRAGTRPRRIAGSSCNGSDEVLAHAFAALLKQNAPLLFPDITHGFYPAYCWLFGI
jgi:histidinol-phosphate aminotransferase